MRISRTRETEMLSNKEGKKLSDTSIGTRFKNAWNVFRGRDPTKNPDLIKEYRELGPAYSYRPDKPMLSRTNKRSIVAGIYNRIAVDCASINIQHVRVDNSGNFQETLDTTLNKCLTLNPNLDQTSQEMFIDVVMQMFDKGTVAIVPVDVDEDPSYTNGYHILSMRVGEIVEWYKSAVKVNLYDEREGKSSQVIVPKSDTAIIKNPFYSIMNEQNSIIQRLIRTLDVIDRMNNSLASNKLDLIIQLPYVVNSKERQLQADKRRREIENQMETSPLGIAYTEGDERIVQLNRSVENNLYSQAMDLEKKLYDMFGISEGILNGTANDQTMLNYYNNIVTPVLTAITNEMTRTFISETGRSQGQTIMFYRDPFKLIPVEGIAKIADTFTRNEIMTANEIRSKIGLLPSEDPKADELMNSNMGNANQKTDIDNYVKGAGTEETDESSE